MRSSVSFCYQAYALQHRHINSVARAALEEGGFLDGPDDLKRNARTGAKGKRKP